MKQLCLPMRTFLKMEGIMCEKGNRQRKALAGKITKGRWQWAGNKRIERARVSSVDSKGNVFVSKLT